MSDPSGHESQEETAAGIEAMQVVIDLREEIERQKELRSKGDAGYVELQRHRDRWRGYAYGKRSRPLDFLGCSPNFEPTEIDRLRQAITAALAYLDVPSVEIDDGVLFANRVLRASLPTPDPADD